MNNFLKKRFNKKSFWGLPATILSATFLYVLFLFLGVIEDFINSEAIIQTDLQFNQLMHLFRSEYLTKIFLDITSLGYWPLVVSISIAFSIIFWIIKKKEYIFALYVSIIGSISINLLSKLAFHRPRPLDPVYLEKGFSFPSGHATIAVALYGFIVYFLFRNTKNLTNKIFIILLGLAIIIAIGFSRLYLGVHYLSDVWAGYLLGLLWLILGISLSEWRIMSKNIKKINTENKK